MGSQKVWEEKLIGMTNRRRWGLTAKELGLNKTRSWPWRFLRLRRAGKKGRGRLHQRQKYLRWGKTCFKKRIRGGVMTHWIWGGTLEKRWGGKRWTY